MLKGNSVLASVDEGCRSVMPLALRYSGDNPKPETTKWVQGGVKMRLGLNTIVTSLREGKGTNRIAILIRIRSCFTSGVDFTEEAKAALFCTIDS